MTNPEARIKHQSELLRAHKAGEKGEYAKAEKIYLSYIEKFPTDPQVLFNLGVLVQRRADNPAERHEAADFYRRCIESPEVETWIKSNAMNNFGLIMGKINEIEKATICFHTALQMNPGNNAARINFADMLRHNGEYEEADRQFAEVLRLDPDSAAAKFSAGMIALLLGDLKRGFELYESRFETEAFPTKPFQTKKPLWTGGEDLNGKRILIWEEQGFGDSFMFCRYFREIKMRSPDCEIWFRGNILYRNIAKGMEGLDFFVALEDKGELHYDFHCPILSLPHRFNTTFANLPSEVPYIFNRGWNEYYRLSKRVPEGRIVYSSGGEMRAVIPRKIGLCWAGSPRHGKDAFRSLAPEAFQPLIDAHPDYQFYSLQVGPRAHECAQLQNIIDLAPTITDFTDTAQAIQQLDLIVSVDTAIVHLAGALDCPCWMITPHSPDWRWMLGREDSPWYSKLRLFRQTTPNDWEPVLKRISNEL